MIGKKIDNFRFWCQRVLPTVYEDSLSYYEYLCKLNKFLNEVITQMNILTDNVDEFETDMSTEWNEYKTELTNEWTETKNYIDNYFNNLDVQTEINNKLDVMASDGTLDALLLPYFNQYKAEINNIISVQGGILNTQNEKIAVLEGRMNEFASLPDGSTSGDAELLDIRVGANGVTYSSAGNAVRAQVTDLKSKTDLIEVMNLLDATTWEIGTLNTNTGLVDDSITSYAASGFIPVGNATKITFAKHRITTFYGSNKAYINQYVNTGSIEYNKTVNIPSNAYYFRTVKGDSWTDAEVCASYGTEALNYNELVHSISYALSLKNIARQRITSSNYTDYFTDFDSIKDNAWYYIINPRTIDADFITSKTCMFQNYMIDNDNIWQTLTETGINPKTYVRYCVNTNWGAWRIVGGEHKFVVDAYGSGDYTSLSQCLIDIREYDYKNATVILKNGTYNIYNELKAIYGNDYWTNYTQTSRYSYGLPLHTGVKILGETGATVVCNNDQLTDARQYFSLFMPYEDGGATIKNVKMVASNIRYCVHCEFSGDNGIGTYDIEHCSMYMDNENNAIWHHSAGVGFGSGKYTCLIVKDCDVHPVFSTHTIKKSAILWHNTAGADPASKVIVEGNYCDADSTISIAESGTGTTGVPALVSNNSIGSALIFITTNEQNVKLYEWNNTLRE